MGGRGAAAKGARWNHAREQVSYTSTSISLAAWETRAHLGQAGARLPFNRYLVRIDVPDDVWATRTGVATTLAPSRPTSLPPSLPVGWDAIPEGIVSRNLGSAWLASGRSVLFVVPSVVIEEENNVLINPAHPDASAITHELPAPIWWDERLYS